MADKGGTGDKTRAGAVRTIENAAADAMESFHARKRHQDEDDDRRREWPSLSIGYADGMDDVRRAVLGYVPERA